MWCDEELEEKTKLRYYKDVINPKKVEEEKHFLLDCVKNHK
jgi:hypothetical protein